MNSLEEEIVSQIKKYSKEAEKYANFKTDEDEKKLDLLLAKATALQEFARWMKDNSYI